jgi:hypothetical protein
MDWNPGASEGPCTREIAGAQTFKIASACLSVAAGSLRLEGPTPQSVHHHSVAPLSIRLRNSRTHRSLRTLSGGATTCNDKIRRRKSEKSEVGVVGSEEVKKLGFLLLAFPVAASAYVDPGGGSMLWQLVATAFIGSLFYIRKMRLFVLRIFRSGKRKEEHKS